MDMQVGNCRSSWCHIWKASPSDLNYTKRKDSFLSQFRKYYAYYFQSWRFSRILFLPTGQYWQVVDGPTSSLTIETADIALGSYTMNVAVYHYRGRDKFIPIGGTSSQFSITGKY